MPDTETGEFISFVPPLWRQRRNLVNEVLKKRRVTSVIDFGCGEGSLLGILVNPTDEVEITRLVGVDIDKNALDCATQTCRPERNDFEFLRPTPLTVDIYRGSLEVADKRLCGFDAIVCIEVVEHLDPPVLERFFEVVLGTYKPKVVIVSTPNIEFNVYFPQLKYGTPEQRLRIEDHRFEWTRVEFQEWCKSGASRYNYSVEFTGVGTLPHSDPAVGHSTQIAIFQDLWPDNKPTLANFGELYLEEHIEFPFYNEPEKTLTEILEEADDLMKYLVEPARKNNSSAPRAQRIKIDQLWEFHRVRLICKNNRERLCEALAMSPDFTLVDEDEVLVHKEYKVDPLDYEEETFSESYSESHTNDMQACDDEGTDSPSAWESVEWITWKKDDIGWAVVEDEDDDSAVNGWGV